MIVGYAGAAGTCGAGAAFMLDALASGESQGSLDCNGPVDFVSQLVEGPLAFASVWSERWKSDCASGSSAAFNASSWALTASASAICRIQSGKSLAEMSWSGSREDNRRPQAWLKDENG